LKISLLTDAPKHNLALMKISTWHKLCGNTTMLNAPIFPSDFTHASILFEKNKNIFIADEFGGPAIKGSVLPKEIEEMKPDYELYNIDYSLGYTFRPCFNDCFFCKVPRMNHPDVEHHSIYNFHEPKFKKVCLLNNNTFQDPKWKETFNEIWDNNLSVIDENGYDLRLLDDEKTYALKKTKFITHDGRKGGIHFAWDRVEDEFLIKNGLSLLNKYKMRSNSNLVYILIGYNTTEEEDLHRCQVVHNFGLTPYLCMYKKTEYTTNLRRFINLHYYRKYKKIETAWQDYKGNLK